MQIAVPRTAPRTTWLAGGGSCCYSAQAVCGKMAAMEENPYRRICSRMSDFRVQLQTFRVLCECPRRQSRQDHYSWPRAVAKNPVELTASREAAMGVDCGRHPAMRTSGTPIVASSRLNPAPLAPLRMRVVWLISRRFSTMRAPRTGGRETGGRLVVRRSFGEVGTKVKSCQRARIRRPAESWGASTSRRSACARPRS